MGSGTTVISPGATVSDVAKYNARIEERTFINEGTFNLEKGDLYVGSGAEFINKGTVDVTTSAESAIDGSAEGVFVNEGTFERTEGSGLVFISAPFENEGTVDAQAGTLYFRGGGSSSPAATWEAQEGARITFNGSSSFTFNEASISGQVKLISVTMNLTETNLEAAEIETEGGNLNVTGTAAIPVLKMGNGSILSGPGTVEIFEHLTWAGGELTAVMSGSGTTLIPPGATVTGTPKYVAELRERAFINEGTFALESGTLGEGEGAEFINKGTFDVTTSAESAIDGSADGVFVNEGTFERTEGSGLVYIGALFENKGTVDAQVGNLYFRGGGTSYPAATWEAQEGARITFNGSSSFTFHEGSISGSVNLISVTMNFEGTDLEAADVEQEGGTIEVTGITTIGTLAMDIGAKLSGPGTLEVSKHLTWAGGEYEVVMSGSGTTVIGPGATVSDVAKYNARFEERTLVNEGTFNLEKGDLNMGSGAEFINLGTFNVTTSAESAIDGSTAETFINQGTFEKTEGSGTQIVAPSFQNSGVIGELTGHFNFLHPVTAAASYYFSKECGEGDPVNCATGNFSESQTDFAIGGLGVGLNLTRTYSAQAAAAAGSPGAFGYGWTASFSDHLASEEEGKRITLFSSDGGTVPFTKTGEGTFKAPSWNQDKLSGSSEAGYTLTLPSQIEEAFSGAGKLESVTDRNGNETTLAYNEAGQLKTITDPAGRELTFIYNGSGRVESVEDPMGHVVKYGYESNNLTSVTMPGEAEPRWQFNYDESHRITKVTNGRGGKTTNEYDGSSRVISQTDPAERTTTFEYTPFHTVITNKVTGSVTDERFTSNHEPYSITHGFGTESATTQTFTYNAAGRVLSAKDGNTHKTTYSYDSNGNRKSEKNAAGNETQWTYNETHDVISLTTPRKETTTIKRDGNGNIESISRPGPKETKQTSTYHYDELGQLESVTDPLERTQTYGYNEQGDRTSETDQIGNTATFVYDEDSRLIATVSPRGNLEEGKKAAEYTTSIERDPQGRPEELIGPLGHTTKYAYDPNGNLEAQTDASGQTTTYTYNADDERTKVEKPNGAVLKTGYDGAGKITSQTDANEKTTTYIRNVLEEPIEVIDPLGRKTTQEFDAVGNVKTVIDPEERETSYSYDPADRLKEVSYSEGATPDAEFEYDADGNVTSMVDGTGETTFKYDQLGRLEQSKDGHGNVAGYKYDLANEQIGLTYPNGKSISREFDEAGRLEKITDWLGGTTTFGFDPDSNLESIAFPAGTGNTDTYTYDQAGGMSKATFAKGAEPLASVSYARDEAGLIESLVSKGLPGAEEEEFSYDENSRLTKAGAASFEYDAANNLTEAPGTTNTYDEASQLETATGASFSYNEEGARTKLTPSVGPATSYKYDQAGNLTGVERAKEGETPKIDDAYAYDGSGVRQSQTITGTTSYMTWDRSQELPLLLRDGSTSYIYGPGGKPIEQISSSEVPIYYHHDVAGSTRLLTDTSGEATATFTYGAYGAPEGSTGLQKTPLGFGGQYTNSDTGLINLPARTYDPITAQFLNIDPLVTSTREPYVYAADDPANHRDSSGLAAEREEGIECPVPICFPFPSEKEAQNASEALEGFGEEVGEAADSIIHAVAGEDEAEGAKNADSSECNDRRYNGDQDALIQLGREAKRKGVSPEEAEVLREWTEEYDVPSRGPESHPGRGRGGRAPHIHVGPINHIPVR